MFTIEKYNHLEKKKKDIDGKILSTHRTLLYYK